MMVYNIEEMSYSELVEFTKKLHNSLLSADEKGEYFKRIDNREKLLNIDTAICVEGELARFEYEDFV